jgi:hypothetical protein
VRWLDVRRLAAVDMYGTAGALRRRRIIVGEYFVGVVLCASTGVLLASSNGTANRLIGWWLLGAAVNYVPLLLSGIALSRPGMLETELAGIDVRAELRRYGLAQLWVAIPCTVAVSALAKLRR